MDTVAAAKAHCVAVGAHPGLPDLLGFGRRVMALTPKDLKAYVTYQIGALDAFLRTIGMTLNHVKAHGAMFLMIRDNDLAEAALDAIEAAAPGAAIYTPGPAAREPFAVKALARGLRVCAEGYPDLEYASDGGLIIERHKRAIDPNLVYDRVTEIISTKRLTTREHIKIPMDVESVCIHGDTPNALDVITAARRAVIDCGREVGCATAGVQSAE
jgi:5-oxoprolinase (ATP-hydrolysing) subunit A